MLELNAKNRKILGKKVKTLRKQGFIPAVVYGEKIKSMPLEIDYHDFEKIYQEAGESTIIKLKVKSPKSKVDESKNVLIYDVAKNPVTDKFVHVDFYAVRMDKLITTEVPLVFEGESLAVKELEGILIKTITEVEVEALPADLPHEIRVDISALKTFEDHIKAKDLKLPEGVKLVDIEPEEVITSVTPPRSEEELAELEEKPAEGEEPEVVKEKEEEEAKEEPASVETTEDKEE